MNFKVFSAVLALAGVVSSVQMPFGIYHTFDLLSYTIATSGWERTSDIVTGPTKVTADHIFRNTTWSIDLPPHLKDLVRKSAPFEWVEAAGTDKISYSQGVMEGVTGYLAQTTKWHILTGYIRTKRGSFTINEQLVTTISPVGLGSGEADGEVMFIRIN
ncbi:hypothetical protein BGW41_003193 [Actinomortierella wolfii]|nr:hypothetical protein BGW41_003193 [Actinomortierella wolfii]